MNGNNVTTAADSLQTPASAVALPSEPHQGELPAGQTVTPLVNITTRLHYTCTWKTVAYSIAVIVSIILTVAVLMFLTKPIVFVAIPLLITTLVLGCRAYCADQHGKAKTELKHAIECQDRATSLFWMRKAAARNYGPAQFVLGIKLLDEQQNNDEIHEGHVAIQAAVLNKVSGASHINNGLVDKSIKPGEEDARMAFAQALDENDSEMARVKSALLKDKA